MNGTETLERILYRAPRELTRCTTCRSSTLAALGLHKLPSILDGRRTGLISGCEDCGLVFVNPSPSDTALESMYGPQGEWAVGRQDDVSAVKADEELKPGSGSWRHMFDGIRHELDVTRPPRGARALDFGCGRGKFLDVLKPCGWDTYGIEPASGAAFVRHHRLDAIPREPAFDLVIVHHVLEHVADPLDLLKQFARATRPGGYVLVAVPRLDTLPDHHDFTYVVSRVHVRSFTSVCMEGLLARAGWQSVEAPPDEVAISGGRRTSARLRMVARLVDRALPLPARPLVPARRALTAYYRQQPAGTLAERLVRGGHVRMAARVVESRRKTRKTLQFVRGLAQRVGLG